MILQICAFLDNETYIPVLHSSFLSNINDISISSTYSLIEDSYLIEENFDNNDIDYITNIFYSHTQDIEK